ncbi:MAG TPA: proliferating cell nuclear antigen (pcna) [archaeon]|nr:proliferating cell nuclear antigen (pcna) [archaeon]
MIELKNTGFLKSSIEAISSFIPEGNLRFNEKGLHFRAIDPSQIVLVDYLVDKNVFDSFDIEPAFVGVNLAELNKIVSRAIQNDTIKIDLSDSELKLDFIGELKRSFKLPLIDVSEEELKLPDAKHDAKVEINSKLFKEALKDASLFSSSIILKVQGKNFFMESKGTAGNSQANSTNGKQVKVISSADVVSKYSLSYLQNIVKEANPDENIVLELKSDAPMKITYNIGKSEIRFFLAHMLL